MYAAFDDSEPDHYYSFFDLESEEHEGEEHSLDASRDKGKQPVYDHSESQEEVQSTTSASYESRDEPDTTVGVGEPSSSKMPSSSKREKTAIPLHHDGAHRNPLIPATQAGNSVIPENPRELLPPRLPIYSLDRELSKTDPLFMYPSDGQHSISGEHSIWPLENLVIGETATEEMPTNSSRFQPPLSIPVKSNDAPVDHVAINCEEISSSQTHTSSASSSSQGLPLEKTKTSIMGITRHSAAVHPSATDSDGSREDTCGPVTRKNQRVRFESPVSENSRQNDDLPSLRLSTPPLEADTPLERDDPMPEPKGCDAVNTSETSEKKSLSMRFAIINSLRHSRSKLFGRMATIKLKTSKAPKASTSSLQQNYPTSAGVGNDHEGGISLSPNSPVAPRSDTAGYPMKSLRRARSSLTILTKTIKSRSIFRRTAVQVGHFNRSTDTQSQTFSDGADGGTSGFNTANIHNLQSTDIPKAPEFTRPSQPESSPLASLFTQLPSPGDGVLPAKGDDDTLQQDPIRVFPALYYHDVRRSLAFLSSPDMPLSFSAISHKPAGGSDQITKIDDITGIKSADGQCISNAIFGSSWLDDREFDRDLPVSDSSTEYDSELGTQLYRTRCREDGNTSLADDNSFLISWLESIYTSASTNISVKIRTLLDGVGFHTPLTSTESPANPGYDKPISESDKADCKDEHTTNDTPLAALGGNSRDISTKIDPIVSPTTSPQTSNRVEIDTGQSNPSQGVLTPRPHNIPPASTFPLRPVSRELPSSLRLMVEAIDKTSGLDFKQDHENEGK